MGLKILTVEKINEDTAYAGSVLFNSNRIKNDAYLIDTDDTVFSYTKNINAVVADKVWVSETLTTTDDIYTSVNKNFYTLPVHDDVNDSASSTTDKPIDANDIAYGIGLPSDSTKSILWIQVGAKKVIKILVDKALGAIEDYIMTGTTTSTTTSTSSTSTTTTPAP